MAYSLSFRASTLHKHFYEANNQQQQIVSTLTAEQRVAASAISFR